MAERIALNHKLNDIDRIKICQTYFNLCFDRVLRLLRLCFSGVM